ncbi:hypothetical protein LCGC14_2043800, partial [marine sediment metagenome]
MNSSKTLFFSALKQRKNWPNVIFFLVLFLLTLAGLAAIATGYYKLAYDNLL